MNKIISISSQDIINRKTCNLDNMIFNTFINLSNIPELKHNIMEIKKILNNPRVQFYIYMIDNMIAGYILGETIVLNDGRHVLYITYLFTAPKYRNHGIASSLLTYAEQYVINKNLNGIMLTTDTQNLKLFNWYLEKGFMADTTLRNYGRYEVLYKII
jgi:ribosomal protein S18 acetylase RimI-like enzyme